MHVLRLPLAAFVLLLACLLAGSAEPPPGSGNWPQWRGPDRTNVSKETGLLAQWPVDGPPLTWKAVGLGAGIATVSVAGGHVYTTGYRDNGEFAYALDEKSGRLLWAVQVGPAVNEIPTMRWLGQRAPTVDDDRVYVVTVGGELICLRTVDGNELWRKNYLKEFGARRPAWGCCDHPLVDGDRLICTPGGATAKLVALDKKTGAVIWKSVFPGADTSAYSPLVVAEAAGLRQYVAFLSRGLVGVAARDGKFLWRYDTIANGTGNSHTPLVSGDLIFCANGYGTGGALLKLVPADDGVLVEERYIQRLAFNSIQDSSIPLLIDKHVYSYRNGAVLTCIDLATGQVVWDQKPALGRGIASMTCAGGRLYLRYGNGRMVLIEATPKGPTEKGRFDIPDHQDAVGSTAPVVTGGQLYLREGNTLLCYDVRADQAARPKQPRTITLPLMLSSKVSEPAPTQPRVGTNRVPDAVYVPTPHDVVGKMLEMAKVNKGDVVYDLGSGDGRIVIAAAKKHGCKAVGYEIDAELVKLAKAEVQKAKLEVQVRIEHEDIFTRDLSGANVIMVYLPPKVLARLLPQLENVKPGTRIVSHSFEIPGVKPDKVIPVESTEDGDRHVLYLWTAPLRQEK